MSRAKKHLSRLGVEPLYAPTVMLTSIIACYLDHQGVLPQLRIPGATWPLRAAGIALALFALALWARAALFSGIQTAITHNQLLTTGPFAIVRNPIYSAFMLEASAIVMLTGNVYLLILPPAYYLFLTLLIKHSEEKWLRRLHGEEFDAYCQRVNRCIPWFPRRGEEGR